MQLKKKGMCDFIMKHNSFEFEKTASPSRTKNSRAGQVLKILASENQDGLFTVAMEPENGEVHYIAAWNSYHATVAT